MVKNSTRLSFAAICRVKEVVVFSQRSVCDGSCVQHTCSHVGTHCGRAFSSMMLLVLLDPSSIAEYIWVACQAKTRVVLQFTAVNWFASQQYPCASAPGGSWNLSMMITCLCRMRAYIHLVLVYVLHASNQHAGQHRCSPVYYLLYFLFKAFHGFRVTDPV